MAREVFALIEERIISGRGILQIPADANYRHFRIWVRVFRPPDPDYVNNKFNPEQGDYANINYMAQGYVAESHKLEYDQQVFELPATEPCGFLIDSLACNFKAIEDVLCLILPAVGAGACAPGAVDFLDAIRTPIDEIYFVCRSTAALQVALYGLRFDQTCPEGAATPKLPAGAPTPQADILPTEPTTPSPPYDPPDDDGNTIPNPIDSGSGGPALCYELIGENATPQNTPGVPIVGNGVFVTEYVRATTIIKEFKVIPTGFYAGALGWFVVADGVDVLLSASEPTITLAEGNPACPPA